MTKRINSMKDVAERTGISVRTLYRYIADGTGPATVVLSNRRVGVLEDDYTAWIMSRRRTSPSQSAA
ncbi:AlpA family transcriptional regulator [Nitrospirillum amazonense]|uniref:AlpA family transcriptional regulator n=1 Tax=Nitrospirillum amazonense TaxID=28077 RepID=A0A560FKM6_9PROT|nr:AlpA family phage regulatory protein [Nitrospirillum amazonense]TWB22151.1 AlpA family transcriptional regulator [Nitrospirillum amazonense]